MAPITAKGAKKMEEAWQVFSNYINGKKLYRIGRQKNPAEPLHSGNVEYFGEYTENETEAQESADKLNVQEE